LLLNRVVNPAAYHIWALSQSLAPAHR